MVCTFCATVWPSTATLIAAPGRPWTTYSVAWSWACVAWIAVAWPAAAVPLVTPPITTLPTSTVVATINARLDVFTTVPFAGFVHPLSG